MQRKWIPDALGTDRLLGQAARAASSFAELPKHPQVTQDVGQVDARRVLFLQPLQLHGVVLRDPPHRICGEPNPRSLNEADCQTRDETGGVAVGLPRLCCSWMPSMIGRQQNEPTCAPRHAKR